MPAAVVNVVVPVIDAQQNSDTTGDSVEFWISNVPVLRISDGAVVEFDPQKITVINGTATLPLALSSAFDPPANYVVRTPGPYGGLWSGKAPDALAGQNTNLETLKASWSWALVQGTGAPAIQTVVGPPGMTNRGTWASGTTYAINDAVTYGADFWVAVAINSASAPTSSNGNWQQVARGLRWLGGWVNSTAYLQDDAVFYGGYSYVALQASTNQQPPAATSNAYWSLLSLPGTASDASTSVVGGGVLDVNPVSGHPVLPNLVNGNVRQQALSTARGLVDSWYAPRRFSAALAAGRVVHVNDVGDSITAGGSGKLYDSATTSMSSLDGGYLRIVKDFLQSFANAQYGGNPVTLRGYWQASVAYSPNDIVLQSGLYYVCLNAASSFPPSDATNWAVFNTFSGYGNAGPGFISSFFSTNYFNSPNNAYPILTTPYDPATNMFNGCVWSFPLTWIVPSGLGATGTGSAPTQLGMNCSTAFGRNADGAAKVTIGLPTGFAAGSSITFDVVYSNPGSDQTTYPGTGSMTVTPGAGTPQTLTVPANSGLTTWGNRATYSYVPSGTSERWQGQWNPNTTYAQNDVVSYLSPANTSGSAVSLTGVQTMTLSAGPATGSFGVGSVVTVDNGSNTDPVQVTAITTSGGVITSFTGSFARSHAAGRPVTWTQRWKAGSGVAAAGNVPSVGNGWTLLDNTALTETQSGSFVVSIQAAADGNYAAIEGVTVQWATTGVMVHRQGHPGLQLFAYYTAPANARNAALASPTVCPAGQSGPDALILALAINDCNGISGNIGPRAFGDYLTLWATTVLTSPGSLDSTDIAILGMAQPPNHSEAAGGINNASWWRNGIAALRQVANSNNWSFLSAFDVFNQNYLWAQAQLWQGADVHPTQLGHQQIATLVEGLFPSGRTGTVPASITASTNRPQIRSIGEVVQGSSIPAYTAKDAAGNTRANTDTTGAITITAAPSPNPIGGVGTKTQTSALALQPTYQLNSGVGGSKAVTMEETAYIQSVDGTGLPTVVKRATHFIDSSGNITANVQTIDNAGNFAALTSVTAPTITPTSQITATINGGTATQMPSIVSLVQRPGTIDTFQTQTTPADLVMTGAGNKAAFQVTVAGNAQAGSLRLLLKAGTGAALPAVGDTFRADIYSDSGGLPNTLVHSGINYAASALTSSYAFYTLWNATALTAGTYWIVLNVSLTGSGSISLEYESAATGLSAVATWSGSAWVTTANSRGYYDLYGAVASGQQYSYFGDNYAFSLIATVGAGMVAQSTMGAGIQGVSAMNTGTSGASTAGVGVAGTSVTAAGISGTSNAGNAGNFSVTGTLPASTSNTALLVSRTGATAVGKTYSGALIYGNDAPSGTGVSTGPLLRLLSAGVDKATISQTGDLALAGGISTAFRPSATDTTLNPAGDCGLRLTASGHTVTLPRTTSCPRTIFVIKNTPGVTGTIIAQDAADTIENVSGNNTTLLSASGAAVRLQSDGAGGWWSV